MIEVLEALQWWQWWVFAMVLVIVETLLPSGILYGVGIAAFAIGAAMAAPNIDVASTWQAQIGGFVGMSIVFGWISRALRNRMLAPRGPDPEIDSRPTQPLTPPRPAPVEANPPASESEPPLNLKNAAPPVPKAPAPKPAAPKPAAKPPAAKKPVAKPAPASPPEPDFVGGIYTIWSPITGGTGSIKIKGTDYALVGPDLPAGSRIKVVAVKNQILKIEPTD
ncbi:MAG: hypothetical protein HOB82_00735 [Alphaproteobacteria bacterium]|jgi:membrane protein implicated in regulation of membrane protease activity|nr:hypothetical protein [Alphaproteobacteria bacterium]